MFQRSGGIAFESWILMRNQVYIGNWIGASVDYAMCHGGCLLAGA